MNWEEVGAIAQVLGSLAVVVTLGYLSIQTRHAKTDLRRSVFQTLAETIISQNVMQVDPRILAANIKAQTALGGVPTVFENALMDRASLSADEARLLSIHHWSNWQINSHMIRNGAVLTPDDHESFRANLRRQYAQNPVGRLWYELGRSGIGNPVHLQYVDNALEQTTSVPNHQAEGTL